MNDAEVKKFITKLYAIYGHLKQKTQESELRDAWKKSFRRFDFDLANEALQGIVDGTYERPFDSDWPAGIGRIVRELRDKRYETKSNNWASTEEANSRKRRIADRVMVARVKPKFNDYGPRLKFAKDVLGEMLFDLWSGVIQREGGDFHFLNIHVLDEFRVQCMNEPEGVDETERRYKCIKCLDSGLVTVFSPVAMTAAREPVYERMLHHRTCVVACGCQSGAKWRQCEKPLPQFDDSRMIDVNGLTVEESESILLETISQLSDYAPENYSDVLASFNA